MSNALERNFECGRCGTNGVVVVAAEQSKTPWKVAEDTILAGGEGMARQDDATSTLGLMRCPTCGERGSFAITGSVLRVIGYVVGGVLALWLIGGRLVRWAIVTQLPAAGWLALLGTLIAIAVSIEVRRWRSAARVTFLKVRAPRGERALPVAVARRVPAARAASEPPPPPIEPVRTTAPEAVQRASDAEGPRFLRGDDDD